MLHDSIKEKTKKWRGQSGELQRLVPVCWMTLRVGYGKYFIGLKYPLFILDFWLRPKQVIVQGLFVIWLTGSVGVG